MKALVVGGSSGIGLSIVLNLLGKGECKGVYVVDKAISLKHIPMIG